MHTIAENSQLLRGLAAPWAVCGGWAIELWLGRPIREHGDVDVTVFRRDQDAVRAHLEGRGWGLTVARDGRENVPAVERRRYVGPEQLGTVKHHGAIGRYVR